MTHFDLIRSWAEARNLVHGSNPRAQVLKLGEEYGELCAALARGQHEHTVDAIGDMIVVLTILAAQTGVEVEDCIASAWNEIKDRRGRMVNGVFVRESV
jgi:NTP pyrophosphatase (non-canonical NTP hydrolase)